MDEEMVESHYCKILDHLKDSLIEGLEFDSPEAAHVFYKAYSEQTGFYITSSRNDDSTPTCRRFVCSEQACEALLMVQLNDSGKWVVACFVEEHNHPLDITHVQLDTRQCIGNHWYPTLHSYFQDRQAETAGFYYAFQVDEFGRTGSVFWADGRSKFLYTQFGDTIVFDTYYRSKRNKDLARFASFVGVNHHKKPILLGCALISDDESEECFTWVFRTWIKAMGGQCPRWIIADQDQAIRRSISTVFPDSRHRFSTWQINEEEERLFLTLDDDDFECEYYFCVFQYHIERQFDSAWKLLLDKFHLNDNLWLNEMYQSRKHWALPYIDWPQFSDITTDDGGNTISFFDDTTFISEQCPADEFLHLYTNVVKQHLKEENKDDLKSRNFQIPLLGIHHNEVQFRQLYTNAIFKDLKKEILKCSEYRIKPIEGLNDQYLLYNPVGPGTKNDRHRVKFNIADPYIFCTCYMFQLKGLLCVHVLKVLHQLKLDEIPSHCILHRWTKNAETGLIRDVDSVKGMTTDLKNLVMWSLVTEAKHFNEMATSSFNKYKIALNILDIGRYELSRLPNN